MHLTTAFGIYNSRTYLWLLWVISCEMQELNIPEKDVEHLLVSLILDNRVHGHIDQVNQLLDLGDRYVCSLHIPFLYE